MKISDDMIRDLQKKVDVSYEEAERYLKKAKGDVDLAAHYIFKNRNSYKAQTKHNVQNIFSNFIKYRLIIIKSEDIIVNIPIVIILLMSLFIFDSIAELFLAVLVAFIIIMATESDVKINKVDQEPQHKDNDFYNAGDGFNYESTYRTTKTSQENYSSRQSTQPMQKRYGGQEIKRVNNTSESDDDFYEITIDE
jgi:hypothetical protein